MKRLLTLIIITVFSFSLGWVFAQVVQPLPTTDITTLQVESQWSPEWEWWWEEWDDCIRLNTDIPFVGRCIKKDTDPATVETNYGNVFPKLVGGLMRVVMAAVVIIGFLAILVGWFMMTAGWVKQDLVNKWRDLIIKVIGWLVLVWLLGIILNLINPNFFKTDSNAWMIMPHITTHWPNLP